MKLTNLWRDFGVYLFCVFGVTFMDLLAMFRTPVGDPLPLPTWRYWIASAVLAIGILIWAESSGEKPGRRTKWKRRAFNAFVLGVTSTKIFEEIL